MDEDKQVAQILKEINDLREDIRNAIEEMNKNCNRKQYYGFKSTSKFLDNK